MRACQQPGRLPEGPISGEPVDELVHGGAHFVGLLEVHDVSRPGQRRPGAPGAAPPRAHRRRGATGRPPSQPRSASAQRSVASSLAHRRNGLLLRDHAAEREGEPVRRMLEEALLHEVHGVRIEPRRRPPHVDVARRRRGRRARSSPRSGGAFAANPSGSSAPAGNAHSTRPRTRAGCASAKRSAVPAPIESPPTTAVPSPAPSSTRAMSPTNAAGV